MKHYAQPGVNVVKCEVCGVNRHGRPLPNGGNVFAPIGLRKYARIRLDGEGKAVGRCHKCGHKQVVHFRHTLGPLAQEDEELIKQAAKRE